jgi:3-hydroxyisobutyrate dehydrogenase
MSRNLVRNGHEVRGFDLCANALDLAAGAGVRATGSVKEAATGVEFVFTMLPVGANVRDVILNDGVLAAADPGTLIADCSTIDVDTAQHAHRAAEAAGFAMLDAPVSGGTSGADAATLTFMCGGEKSAFSRAAPLLRAMGANIVHCGGPGMGQATKICNNMIAGVTFVAVAEAFTLGERLGVDRQVLYDVISTSTGSSHILNNSCPVPGPVPTSAASNGFRPGFAAKLMLKDLRLSQAAAQSAATPTALGAVATAAYAMHVNNGFGELDCSSVVKLVNPEL